MSFPGDPDGSMSSPWGSPGATPAAAPAATPGAHPPALTPPVGADQQGVIHDIGYRHYDGRRLGAAPITRALCVDTLRGCYGLGRSARSKVMPFLLFALACLPAVVVVVVLHATSAEELPLSYAEYVSLLQVVTGLYVAGQAPQALSRDLRFRTVSLYFSRPMERSHYVLAKYTAMSTAILVFSGIPLLILYLGALLARLPLGEQTRGLFIGLVGCLLFALLLAGLGLVIAAVTPRRGLGVAAIITVLLVANSVRGAGQGLAMERDRESLAGYLGMVSPEGLVNGLLTWLFDLEPMGAAGPPGTTGGLVFLAVTLLVLGACYGTLLLRYRKVAVS